MAYIQSISSISHQESFLNEGFSAALEVLEPSSALKNPVYKDYIDSQFLRRMSPILRMGITAALSIQNEIEPKGVIVGTGLGCLTDTEKFLKNYLTLEGLVPPTAFIQSTHNTIAGQISINSSNQYYNCTHTQNTVSFEVALQDALLHISEGVETLLVGGVDEATEELKRVLVEFGLFNDQVITSGATFLNISKEKGESSIFVKDVMTNYKSDNNVQSIRAFLEDNQLSFNQIDHVLYASSSETAVLETTIEEGKRTNYIPFTGVNCTASALATHIAVDKMKLDASLKNVLIINALNPVNLGVILLQQ